MPAKRQPREVVIYRLKVTLKDFRPPIWRRAEVRDDITLAKLHRILQIVMGWYDCHLHAFTVRGIDFGEPEDDETGELGIRSERRVKLSQIIRGEKDRFTYTYDFGDGWEHEILVEKILPPEPGVRYPRCLVGKGACPPEDVGGVYGYADFLEAIQDPNHPEHDEYLEWIGGEFDPNAFDLEGINGELRGIR
jgi:hypothetical protein